MLLRNSRYVLAFVVVASVFSPRFAFAQEPKLESPLQLTSLEWLVADGDVVVCGVVTDLAADQNWSIVTLEVRETLKGAKAERLQFVLHKFDQGDALLGQAKKSKGEQLWILKRQGGPGEAPNREKVMARHKTDLYAPFVPGRPGQPALPMIPLGSQADQPPLSFLTADLQILNTSDQLVAAIRKALADTQGQERPRSYAVALPEELARGTGFSRSQNQLVLPLDSRLEELARRLVRTPADFLAQNNAAQIQLLRLEGVKALRNFPSEANVAIVRAWLDDPMTAQPYRDNQKLQPARLVPAGPKSQQAAKTVLPTGLAEVPEIHFQQPLTKAMKTDDAQLHTAVTIDNIHLLNGKKTDAYIENMMSSRPDLAGLSFVMGNACRMKPEVGRQFVKALEAFRKAESSVRESKEDGPPPVQIMRQFKESATQLKIDPSASVATLMQVFGHEDGRYRLNLVNYLDGLARTDATRALAKLAVFSQEPEVSTAAREALKKRDAKDYSDILVSGLNYPWPAVAERASEAIVKLGRKDLLPQLIEVLEKPDPRAPQERKINGKKVSAVREVVRVNHAHNCLLCHAPAARDVSKEEQVKLEGLTAQIPVPSESLVAYYRPSAPQILVRIDVTYLRQDFSMKLPVANADPWPDMQRYDFLVRTREVTDQEARSYQELLKTNQSDAMSPYRRAAVAALRELTGRDAQPTATAWRKVMEK